MTSSTKYLKFSTKQRPARLLVLFSGLLISPLTLAHVRWFIDPTEIPEVSFKLDDLAWLTIAGAAGFTIWCVALEKLITKRPPMEHLLKRPISSPYSLEWYLLLVFVNLLLAINLMIGEFLAPNLVLAPEHQFTGIIIQLVVLLSVLFSVSLAGMTLILTAFLSLLLFPVPIAMDYFFELTGIGCAYILIAPHICHVDRGIARKLRINTEHTRHLASRALQIGLGLQLFTLAVHNKLTEPGASLLFLQDYPVYNFMQGLGFTTYSHLHFVLAAGLFEAVFGILLCLGIAVRFVGLVLALVFTLTAVMSGIEEIFGHLPLFIVVAIIILHGNSARIQANNHLQPDGNAPARAGRSLVLKLSSGFR